jgi:predicted thioesterase/GNAT superfamily N-acetyltransferase
LTQESYVVIDPAARLAFTVTADDTAVALGSGDVPVLATPRLIAWLEAATVAALGAQGSPLPTDETSVGTRVDIEHLAASPVGASVEATAEVIHRDGRLVRFAVAAHHDSGAGPVLVARGEVTRVVVRRAPFLERLGGDLVIREARSDELAAVGELRVAADIAGYGMATEEVGYAAVLRDAPGQAGEATVLIALRRGEIVGTVTLAEPGRRLAEVARPGELEFRFMAVAPHARRRGIARALMDTVIARADGRPLVCSVIEGNDPATELYLSRGFGRATDRDHSPVPGVSLWVYSLPTP